MTMHADKNIDQVLLDGIVDFVAPHPNSDVQRFSENIVNWGSGWTGVPPAHLTASNTFESALARSSDQTSEIMSLFARHRQSLHWRQSYSSADSAVGRDMLSNYGYAEIIGQKGPFISTKLRAGVAVYGPNLNYPPHHHSAEEIYAVLAGTAMCILGDRAPALRKAGDVLYHGPNVSHGLQTQDEPLAIVYLWQNGDLREKPSFL